MKVKFDLKYRQQIESGEYRVETVDGRQVRIVCWDARNPHSGNDIVTLVSSSSGEAENILRYYSNGHLISDSANVGNKDLIVVIPDEDERTRNSLLKHLRELREWHVDEMPPIKIPEYYDTWIDYLEKRKEQKPVPINPDDMRMLERIMQLVEFCNDKEIIRTWLCEKVKFATPVDVSHAEWSEDKYPKNIETDAVMFCFDNGFNITPYQAGTIAKHYYELGFKRIGDGRA